MLRLPPFTHHRPETIAEAVAIRADHGPDSMFVAGGTDLYPNMKRQHQTPGHVVSLAGLEELRNISGTPSEGMTVGAMTLLREIERHPVLCEHYPGFVNAVTLISTPLLRNMGTIGGNLLLDTRCSYYDQSHEWRESIDFCMKRDGPICWVAPSSKKCLAVQSSDSVPLLCAIGAEVTLVTGEGERRIPLDELYRDDGIHYLRMKPGELLTQLHLPAVNGWRSSYRKLRRRGTFDFPVLGVGACLSFDGAIVSSARIRIGGTASMAVTVEDAQDLLTGRELTDDLIEEAAQLAFKPTRAMDNTDHEAGWRKKMAPVFVARALHDCRPS